MDPSRVMDHHGFFPIRSQVTKRLYHPHVRDPKTGKAVEAVISYHGNLRVPAPPMPPPLGKKALLKGLLSTMMIP